MDRLPPLTVQDSLCEEFKFETDSHARPSLNGGSCSVAPSVGRYLSKELSNKLCSQSLTVLKKELDSPSCNTNKVKHEW